MTEAAPQWSDEAVAASFRSEIQARFEAHNAAFRAKEEAELEEVLRKHPDKTGEPGYEVHDSLMWRIYQECEIRIDRNLVAVVLPPGAHADYYFVHMFDNTTASWSRPFVKAELIDGEARVVIDVLLVATWDDAMDAKWKADPRNGDRRVLCELTEGEIRALCDLIDGRITDAKPLMRARDMMKLDLEVLL